MAQRLKNGTWLVQLRDPHTRERIPIRGETEGEVIARAQRIKQVWRDQKAGLPLTQEALAYVRAVAEGPYTLARAWEEYTEGRPEVRAIWARHFAEFFGNCLLADATAERLARWEASRIEPRVVRGVRREAHAPKTIRLHFDLLKACVRRQIPKRLSSLPWGDWRPSGKGRVREYGRQWAGSVERVGALLLVARQHDAEVARWNPQNLPDLECRLVTGGYCGLRQGELGGLGWDDLAIDAPPELLMVRHKVKRNWRTDHPEWTRPLDPPKDRRPDNLDPPQRLHPIVVRALRTQRALLASRGLYRADGPVFPDRLGRWRKDPETVDVERLQKLVARAWPDWPEARVQAFVMHSLRHTFSTLEGAAIVMAGGNLRDVATRTRHRDLKVVQGYIHATGDGLIAPMVPEPANLPVIGELVGQAMSDLAAGLPSAALMTSDAARAAEHARTVDELERRMRGRREDFASSFSRWESAGRPGDVPEDVRAQAHRHYHRARQEYRRKGCSTEEALVHARATRHAYLNRWRQYVRARDGAAPLVAAQRDVRAIARADDLSSADVGRAVLRAGLDEAAGLAPEGTGRRAVAELLPGEVARERAGKRARDE